MKVLNINGGSDTAGAGWLLGEGFRRHPQPGIDYQWTVRRGSYFDYPPGLPWSQHRHAWQRTDVLHLRNNWNTFNRLVPRRPPVPTVIHYHGSAFRAHADRMLGEQRQHGAIGAVSTLDLWLVAPDELTWLPQCHDLQALAALRERRPGPLRIGHAPTNRKVKSTEAFLEAARRQPAVEVVLIEGRSWAECVKTKATCDVYFDQAILGYGNNSVEAWAMGIPVVCGAAPETMAEFRRRFDRVPFVEVTPDNIGDGLEVLLDEGERETWGQVGREHVARWHDAYPVQVAASLYRKAAGV